MIIAHNTQVELNTARLASFTSIAGDSSGADVVANTSAIGVL